MSAPILFASFSSSYKMENNNVKEQTESWLCFPPASPAASDRWWLSTHAICTKPPSLNQPSFTLRREPHAQKHSPPMASVPECDICNFRHKWMLNIFVQKIIWMNVWMNICMDNYTNIQIVDCNTITNKCPYTCINRFDKNEGVSIFVSNTLIQMNVWINIGIEHIQIYLSHSGLY